MTAMRDMACRALPLVRPAARDLPWRQPDTAPWGVLVSEVMLQQTPVVRVEPAWRAWMTRWPTPADLAADPPAEAIRMWGRLGYPRRAHAAARLRRGDRRAARRARCRTIWTDCWRCPAWARTPARAVATFAYGQRHPVVDTNVRRVVARAVEAEPTRGPTTTADLVA